MAAVQAMTGGGGWPMSVFLTPDGRPFYGGTYFPETPRHGLPSFRQVLEGVARAYREQRPEVERSGAAIVAAIAERRRFAAAGGSGDAAAGWRRRRSAASLTAAVAALEQAFDAGTAAGAARRSSRSR